MALNTWSFFYNPFAIWMPETVDTLYQSSLLDYQDSWSDCFLVFLS